MSDEQLSMLITGAIPVVLAAFGAAISWLNLQKTRAEREQAKTERELAQLASSAALDAASETVAARDEMVTLGAALGASSERSGGAPRMDT